MTVTDQLKVLVGLRYDNLSQDRDDKTSKNLDLNRTDNTYSPRIVVYQSVKYDSTLYFITALSNL